MKINTALILCAGFGERLNPLTLKTPKPLLKLKDITVLESCINIIVKLGVKKIFLNTFYLSEQIFDFIKNKNFPVGIKIIQDGDEILDTGGGIKNMTNHFQDNSASLPTSSHPEPNSDHMRSIYYTIFCGRKSVSFGRYCVCGGVLTCVEVCV